MGSIIASLASSMAFSGVPPMPMPSTPGGHQPAPMAGTIDSTQSLTESLGFSTANLAFASLPPPLAATSTFSRSPGTRRVWITAGVLSPVLVRSPSGSASTEPRSRLSGCMKPRRTPSFTMSSTPISPCQRTSMPTLRKTITIPVS